MTISANVAGLQGNFHAVLSDGRTITAADLYAVASALFEAGVASHAVKHEFHAGQRMLTAGQRVAIFAEIRKLEQRFAATRIAA